MGSFITLELAKYFFETHDRERLHTGVTTQACCGQGGGRSLLVVIKVSFGYWLSLMQNDFRKWRGNLNLTSISAISPNFGTGNGEIVSMVLS